jgi:hypothetical protein
MSRLTLKQIKGLQELIQDAVEAGANATEEVHQAIARQPYALLRRIPGIAQPARVVEQFQHALTSGVYQSIRLVNRGLGRVAGRVLQDFEKYAASLNDSRPAQ